MLQSSQLLENVDPDTVCCYPFAEMFLYPLKRLPRLQISSPLKNILVISVLAFLFGVFWYWMLYGHFHLYYTHVNWIYQAGGDVLQHQLGWEFFRQEPWQFPLGKITAYGYPIGTSVTFMDSIPLLAIPLKLISHLYKQNHQYFGVWELSAVIGQMLAGMLILREFTRSYLVKILGASLLVLSPPMIFRAFYHSSLSAHWILLLAIWFILIENRQKLWRGAWLCLFAVAILINVYYVPMLLPLWLIGMYFRYRSEKRGSRKILNVLVDGIAVSLVVFLVGYSIGLFSLSYGSLSVRGYSDFSWNLNGFINPFEYSSNFVKGRDTGVETQYEGFSYLGIGNLLMFPAAVYIFLEKNDLRRRLAFLIPFGVVSIVYILFSLSNRAFFDTQPIWDIQLSDSVLRFLNLFRASGRFIWPVFYLLVLFGIIVIIRNVRYPIPLLFVVVLVQFIDIQPLYQPKELTRITRYHSPLKSEFWKSAVLTNKHLVIIPASRLRPPYETFAIFAVRNQLTLNLGYFARSDEQAFEEYRDKVWEDLKAQKSDAHTIYILSDPVFITFAKENLANHMFICEIDDFNVLFSAENELVQSIPDFSPYCSVPVP
jgi:hypothetical protein